MPSIKQKTIHKNGIPDSKRNNSVSWNAFFNFPGNKVLMVRRNFAGVTVQTVA